MMNRWAAMLLLAGVLGALPARAAFINGRSYTAMSDWASANNFRLQARQPGAAIYTNRAQAKIAVYKDSRVAKINGVNVALSFPVAYDRGALFISQFDLAKTVTPLIIGQRNSKPVKVICIDPGHGGKDTGNVVGYRAEKTYTLLLAQELAAQLKSAGYKVILTRTRDTYPELSERADIANRNNADLFLSLHFNAVASGKSEVSGVETYCITPVGASSSNSEGRGAGYGSTPGNRMENKSLLLAFLVQKALVKGIEAEDRAVRRARFAVLRDAEMPAILIESGYMTHPIEGKKIFDAVYRQQTAKAIARGINDYIKLTGSTAPTSSSVSKKPTATSAK